jgi:hypothetical protein
MTGRRFRGSLRCNVAELDAQSLSRGRAPPPFDLFVKPGSPLNDFRSRGRKENDMSDRAMTLFYGWSLLARALG